MYFFPQGKFFDGAVISAHQDGISSFLLHVKENASSDSNSAAAHVLISLITYGGIYADSVSLTACETVDIYPINKYESTLISQSENCESYTCRANCKGQSGYLLTF